MPWWRDHLACPDCQSALDGEACSCGFTRNGRDFRPQHPRPRPMTFTLGMDVDLAGIVIERPAITYDGPRAGRDSSELFSVAAPWLVPGARLLDLGCGPRDQAAPAAHGGASYVGIDYASEQADLLADAHAIPFRHDTFDVVLSYAVLEHLYHPFLAVQEVARVLRPGGVYAGTVSQGAVSRLVLSSHGVGTADRAPSRRSAPAPAVAIPRHAARALDDGPLSARSPAGHRSPASPRRGGTVFGSTQVLPLVSARARPRRTASRRQRLLHRGKVLASAHA